MVGEFDLRHPRIIPKHFASRKLFPRIGINNSQVSMESAGSALLSTGDETHGAHEGILF